MARHRLSHQPIAAGAEDVRQFQQVPVYKVAQESGPDHAKMFHVIAYVDGREAGLGVGATKKEAEQRSAFDALSKLENS